MRTISIIQSGFFLKHKLLNKIFVTVICFVISYTAFTQDAATYYNQGLAKETEEKYKEAILLYDKAIALKADFATAWMDRGNCKDALGLFKEAIADYDQSIQLDPSNKDAWFNRGLAKYDAGNLEGAIADLTHLLELNPNDGEAYHSRGFAYADLGISDSACADFQKAVNMGIEVAKEDLALCNPNTGKESVVILDTTGGQARLIARGPMVKNIGKDSTYGIFFIAMPAGLGVFGSDISYNEALNADPSASIKIELKNGKTVSAAIVLTGKHKAAEEPILFMGVFDRSNKEKLLESDLKKIEIDSDKAHYEYEIREGYATNLKLLLQRSYSMQAKD